jgi:hypothetical protein
MSSYRPRFDANPRTYEEAALMQHSDIEKAMIDLAEKLAQLGLVDNTESIRLFSNELNFARDYQAKLGSKARYRNVNYQR